MTVTVMVRLAMVSVVQTPFELAGMKTVTVMVLLVSKVQSQPSELAGMKTAPVMVDCQLMMGLLVELLVESRRAQTTSMCF